LWSKIISVPFVTQQNLAEGTIVVILLWTIATPLVRLENYFAITATPHWVLWETIPKSSNL